MTNFRFFSANPARGIIRANPSNPWLASPQLRQPTASGSSASHPSCYAIFMSKTTIQAELPPELTARALTFVQEGWASDFNELLADALRRFLESHSARVTESMVLSDVQWGLHGHD